MMRTPFFHSLRFKVGFGYIVLVIINLAVTAWAIYNFGRLTLSLKTVLNENYPNVIILETMAHVVEQQDHALSTILSGDLERGEKEFAKAKHDFYAIFNQAKEIHSLPDVELILENIHSTYEGYLLVSDSLSHMAGRGDIAGAKAYYSDIVRPFSQRLSDNSFWLIEINQKQMDRLAQQTNKTSDEAVIAVLFAALLATGLSIITTIQFTKRIIEPAERLTETVHQIGRGRLDLKIDIQTNDEVGELSREFNKMTERLRKFEELNIEKIISEKQKSETIVHSISDAIIVCDPELNIQLVNHAAEELLSLKQHEVIGRKVENCVVDKRLLEIFKAPENPFLLDRPYFQFRRRGRLVYLRPRISKIPTLHGEHGGLVLILQDVTQFKELDKMKSDFMAAVSHEFRTPLTSINMSVDILRQQLLGPLTSGQDDLVKASKQDCERLTKLVKELLQLSRLESGKVAIGEEIVDIHKVIEATLHPLQLPFKEKGVELKVVVDKDLPTLIGDEQQLSWILSNLVNNALRYTNRGGSVEIKAQQDNHHILFQVRDTGKGIPPEYLEKIFDKFVQVKQSLDPTPGSVGLGLSIAKEIVEMYGGKMWVESKVNKGSTFSFRLPFGQVNQV